MTTAGGSQLYRVLYSSLFFIIVMLIVVTSKPSPIYDDRGTVIPFGVGPGKTLLSLGTATVLVAVLSFFLFTSLDVLFNAKTTPV